MLSTTKKNNPAHAAKIKIMIVARTTLSRDGQTTLNHSPRTDLKNSSIFFIKNRPKLRNLYFFQNIPWAHFEKLAGAEGIEPSSAVLETDILPLNYAPKELLHTTRCANSLRQDSTPT